MKTIELIQTNSDTPSRVTAAKNIRIELKAAFPNTKFKVTSESFSMGNAIDISWVDGPTIKEAEKITDKYQYGDFDGMTDSYNYRDNRAFTDKYGSSKYVNCSRRYSDESIQAAIDETVNKWGMPHNGKPTVELYKSGNMYGLLVGNVTDPDFFRRELWYALTKTER